MDVTSIIDPLNADQREAVTRGDSHLLVLAGAGSGKTRVLVHRIAWLVAVENVSPHAILAVTFTNKAAREMRGRIDELLGISTRNLWVGTFHGLAHRLLRRHWKDAGLPENFQILDSEDQLRLVKRVIQAEGIDEDRWPPRQAQWFINAQKDEGLRPQHIQETGDAFHRTMLTIYRRYEEACRTAGLVDFGELLLRSHELWLEKPALLEHYRQRFQHLLVDEFQDTNAIQYAWLRLLAGDQAHISAVGDDDQSIYGWRGARIENILNFTRDYSDTYTVRLEQNYRSTATILKAANSVISRNADRLGKRLWTEGDEGQPISLYAAFNEQDEARFVAEQIIDWVGRGNPRREVAVLYRSNAQSRVLEESLLREQISYRIYGGQRFYERLEIKNALAYLRLVVNRHDTAAFERVINTPTRGIGEKTLQTLRDLARSEELSLWRAAEILIDREDLPARAESAVGNFMSLIARLEQETDGLPLDEQVDHVLRHSGLLDFHRREKGERGRARVENLEELVTACRTYTPADTSRSTLGQFLDEASLDAGDYQADESEDAVQLMTLHSAKGLEFPLVFMTGMEENLFPHRMSIEEAGRLEEERRLCYVGITRAMSKLCLTFAECRRLYGAETYNGVSRFVKDIPGDLIEETRLRNQISRPTSYAKKPAGSYSDSGMDTGFSLGQRVDHKVFGEGVVLNFEGNGSRARVQVNFDAFGTKWLLLGHANLQPSG